LTGLNADHQGRVLLRDFGLDGFVVEPVSFYAPIEKMLDAIRKPGRERLAPAL
jgi:hypothetical protein